MKDQVLFRSLYALDGVKTSHGCGEKRVLLANEESASNLTQIASTILKEGEVAEEHAHPTMEECFLIQSGRIRFWIEGEEMECFPGDFVRIPKGKKHTLEALEDCSFITIGCATDNA